MLTCAHYVTHNDRYTKFITDVVAPRVAQQWNDSGASSSSIPLDTIVFQRQPCLRVSPPKSGPIGRRHRDRDYGHQPGQINYWLPLASAAAENTLWVERVAHLEAELGPVPEAVPEAEAEAAAGAGTTARAGGGAERGSGCKRRFSSTNTDNDRGARNTVVGRFREMLGVLRERRLPLYPSKYHIAHASVARLSNCSWVSMSYCVILIFYKWFWASNILK